VSPASCVAGPHIPGSNEVLEWGHQIYSAERVLGEAASLGLPAVESSPEGFLSPDPAEASRI
jgi:hypothetical protein